MTIGVAAFLAALHVGLVQMGYAFDFVTAGRNARVLPEVREMLVNYRHYHGIDLLKSVHIAPILTEEEPELHHDSPEPLVIRIMDRPAED